MSSTKQLTPDLLKRIIAEEKRKLKVDTKEVKAKDLASSLANHVDYLKALKIQETDLRKKLSKVINERKRIKDQLIKAL